MYQWSPDLSAGLAVIKQRQRLTLAVRAVRKKEGLPGALQGLWQRFAALGGPMGGVSLDRGGRMLCLRDSTSKCDRVKYIRDGAGICQ
jgi:hypothetical protein